MLVYREGCVRLYVISSPQRSWNPRLALYDDNFWQFHVLYACTSDACALETRRRFVTERKQESRNLNPGFTAWVINVFFYILSQYMIYSGTSGIKLILIKLTWVNFLRFLILLLFLFSVWTYLCGSSTIGKIPKNWSSQNKSATL